MIEIQSTTGYCGKHFMADKTNNATFNKVRCTLMISHLFYMSPFSCIDWLLLVVAGYV